MSSHIKRPVSLSDSHIYIGDYKLESINDFHVRSVPFLAEDSPVAMADIIIEKQKKSIFKLEFFLDYSMRFVGHVFLISIFEALFFFTFVSKDEDKGILLTTNYYTETIINSCSRLNKSDNEILNLFLKKFINSSNVLADGNQAAAERAASNLVLYNISWSYVGILGGIQSLLFIISFLNKFKIRWTHIIFENLALVCFLGIYEYMFFESVIKKYNTESPEEISAMFVKGLQQRCDLLTAFGATSSTYA